MSNPQLQMAEQLIRGTDLSVFLTGKAGTGKTTFLHTLKADLPKRTVVTAPTGVAAINSTSSHFQPGGSSLKLLSRIG